MECNGRKGGRIEGKEDGRKKEDWKKIRKETMMVRWKEGKNEREREGRKEGRMDERKDEM